MKTPSPPLITPFAILSIIILIGTSNLVVNRVTHTHEGAPSRPTRVVNQNQPVRQPQSRIPQSRPNSSTNARNQESRPVRPSRRVNSGTNQQPSQRRPVNKPANRPQSSGTRSQQGE